LQVTLNEKEIIHLLFDFYDPLLCSIQAKLKSRSIFSRTEKVPDFKAIMPSVIERVAGYLAKHGWFMGSRWLGEEEIGLCSQRSRPEGAERFCAAVGRGEAGLAGPQPHPPHDPSGLPRAHLVCPMLCAGCGPKSDWRFRHLPIFWDEQNHLAVAKGAFPLMLSDLSTVGGSKPVCDFLASHYTYLTESIKCGGARQPEA
jgi:hypothetical protein